MSQKPFAHSEAASTLAVVEGSNEPLLFLTADQRIIAASASFYRAFDIDPATIAGRHVSEIGAGEWAMPGLASLLSATASGTATIHAYEVDLQRPGQQTRRLIVNARTLDDGDPDHVRLLMAITDVTDARSEARKTDELVREKAVLLQELQHRVANSLQIIASVLMQSARRVQSEETRGHLHNARQRILSVAAMQTQLSAVEGGKVALRAYLNQLCQSLAASMIGDKDRLSISVAVDDSVVEAKASVSLGLIVTELVINALKHAFRDQPVGTIRIAYNTVGDDWTLTVVDDGVGMSTGHDAPKAGLGTGIVEALARNLHAKIKVSDANPGTAVMISCCMGIQTDGDLRPAA